MLGAKWETFALLGDPGNKAHSFYAMHAGKVESACGSETTIGKRCAGGAECADHCVRALPALARLLQRSGGEKAPRLYGLGVLGQACTGIRRCEGAGADSGACAGGAWVEPYGSAFYGRWLWRLSLSGALRRGVCFTAARDIARRRDEASGCFHHERWEMRSSGE